MNLENKEKKFLLKIARDSITNRLKDQFTPLGKLELTDNLKKTAATFVTLTIDGQLRGCIGKLQAVQELYKDVIENARSAAFSDPRFPSLSIEELDHIKIEISILTKPEKFEYSNPAELISYLDKNKPGVVIHKDYHNATFLPQVWDELPEASEFLAYLCQKAGLNKDSWKSDDIEVETYEVIKFSE